MGRWLRGDKGQRSKVTLIKSEVTNERHPMKGYMRMSIAWVIIAIRSPKMFSL